MAVNFSKSWAETYVKVCYAVKMTETWKPAPGYEGFYEVSSKGGVRSVERQIRKSTGKVNTYRGRDIKTQLRSGYPSFVAATGSSHKTVTVHRLVCEAFHGPSPEGKPLACHKNGVKSDNRPENLYWGTWVENGRDAVNHGQHHYARKTTCGKGHLYSEENTRIRPNGHRVCRTCHRDRERLRRRRTVDISGG